MRNKLVFLLFFLLFFCQKIKASHIVGGEFQVNYSGQAYIYNVNLNMYYDDINANDGLLNTDININVSIFEKSSNLTVKTFQLTRQSYGLIDYTTNGCNADDILRTRILRYRGNVDLAGLTSPAGYYIVWERCCRNYQTLNIVHQNSSGQYIGGQAFYLEFPPVTVGGIHFVNSSPSFGLAPAQYLCKNNYTTIDFSGIFNGHSLAGTYY